ncbi:MAG: TIGR00296 family protein [Desulfurococcaceae archaeon TW002]
MCSSYVDPEDLTPEEGTFLVKLARRAVENYVTRGVVIELPENTPQKLRGLGASFVTLLKISGAEARELRGCIGYIKPVEPLALNVIHAAIAAATEDPRFLPLEPKELKEVIFEVSVLSKMIEISRDPRKRPGEFLIGRDGLMMEHGFYSGLLLPEVPVEYCWDNETFLAETCFKAGLSPDCWLNEKVRVFRFSAKTFKEVRPGGDVVIRDFMKEYLINCGRDVVKPR